MPRKPVLDVAIVGGGIAGVIHLHYARQAGLDALVLERQDGVGGLWRQLPAWQDIQISPVDWALGDLPLAGPMQPQILANAEAWVARFALADGIRLRSPVRRARHTGTCWELDTAQGLVRARHLVAATGGHNLPVIPEVQRRKATVRERHASALHAPEELAGRDVVVVGGGASAFDLLDQCLEHNARRIVWVYRGLRWFTPTRKPKVVAGSVRPYAKMQASGMTAAQQNAAIREDLSSRYQKFGIEAIQPPLPIDLLHDQLIPGRPRMLANFQAFERHTGSVLAIEGQQILLSDGTRLDADLLLWGTGYALDLAYFEALQISRIGSVHELSSRSACLFRSLDAPDLYFPSVILEGIGATPWANMLIARSIMSHIRGTAQLDMEPVGHKINHFDIARYLAQRDTGSYTKARGWDFYRDMALNTAEEEPYPIL